jgi:hypothetical protein
MARQDINMDVVYGELETSDNLAGKVMYDFRLLGEQPGLDNDNYSYAEIEVFPGFEKSYKEEDGIHVWIPYTAEYKSLKVRFRINHGTGQSEYVLNRKDNQVWFQVYRSEGTDIKLSEYRLLNENDNFNLILKDFSSLLLFSGNETDLMIRESIEQNKAFLLKSFAGNLYQYPTTGVGLIEFLHGNFENTNLAQKLQEEFDHDKVTVINAYMDSVSGELALELKEQEE